jgi:ParB-like chromosome segregation protein Spo0J
MKVHPAADVFPMLPDDELQELAADIKANGLREALKVSNGLLIDGRNRLAACKIAGLEPRIEELNGVVDPVAYILSANINRRHMTKGQRAMAVAMIVPKQQGKKTSLKINDVSGGYVRQARAVLEYAPKLREGVLNGGGALNEAYEEAKRRKAVAESADARLKALRAIAPDLSDLVTEERMTLTEAEAAHSAREEQRESELRVTRRNLESVLLFLCAESKQVTPLQQADSYSKALSDFKVTKLEFAAQTMALIAGNKKKELKAK